MQNISKTIPVLPSLIVAAMTLAGCSKGDVDRYVERNRNQAFMAPMTVLESHGGQGTAQSPEIVTVRDEGTGEVFKAERFKSGRR